MQIDDDFLAELGLETLPESQRAAFKQHVYETLELRVGEALSLGLSDAELAQFEAIIDHDLQVVTEWLDEHVPDFLADPLYAKMSSALGADAPAVVCEYAASKWLEVRRPDYRDTVRKILDDIKVEIRAHVAHILTA